MSAWQAVIIGAAVTIILAITVWGAPAGTTSGAWAIGARGHDHPGHHGVGRAGRDHVRSLGHRGRERRVGDRLDHVLGRDHLQHAGPDRRVPVRPQGGQVIRHNQGWTLILLGYLILIALFYRFVLPAAMR